MVAAAALMLDGADGWAARRQGLASAFGARFDMEVDAFAILVLTITAIRAHAVPGWVFAIGAMRYLYLAAALVLPLLRRPLPPRSIADRRRKTAEIACPDRHLHWRAGYFSGPGRARSASAVS